MYHKLVVKIVPFLFCLYFIGFVQKTYLLKSSSKSAWDKTSNTLNVLNEQRKNLKTASYLPSVGFANIKANWAFLSFLQYFGDDKARSNSGYTMSADFFESIIRDDPRYLNFYIFLSGSASLYAGTPERSVNIMEDGLSKLNPQKPESSYYMWRLKGVDELLFLNSPDKAQKSFQTAADWADTSKDDSAKAIAEMSRQTAEFLRGNPESKPAQIGAWATVLSNAFDDKTRSRAISEIEALGGDVIVDQSGQIRIQQAQNREKSES